MTRGEQGLLISLNTRWLSHYVRLRQLLGIAPVRYKFGPTAHDPLAQFAGRFTFWFDSQRRLWQTLGGAETGADTFVRRDDAKIARGGNSAADDEDLCRSGIESNKPLTLRLHPILYAAPLPAGRYRLRLWMVDPTSTAAGQRLYSDGARQV